MNGAGVAGPAGLDRQQVEVDVVAGEHDLLARAAAHRSSAASRRSTSASQARAPSRASPCGGCISSTSSSFVGDVVEPLDAEGEAHPPLGAELVDQQRMLGALRALEEERRPAGLDRAVDDLRDLEVRIDLGGDADELALALEQRDPVAQVARALATGVSLMRDEGLRHRREAGSVGGHVARELRERGVRRPRRLGRPARHAAAAARRSTGCDAVVHVAALYSFTAPARALEAVNVEGTRNVIEACRAEGVERLLRDELVRDLRPCARAGRRPRRTSRRTGSSPSRTSGRSWRPSGSVLAARRRCA